MGCVDGQRRRHRLPDRALPGQRAAPASPRSRTTPTDDDLQGHWPVSASTSYSYRVRATDAAGNLSPYSNTASATTPPRLTRPRRSQPGTLTRDRGRPAARSTCPGVRPPTTSGSPATRSSAARAAAAPTSPRSPPRPAPAPPTKTPASVASTSYSYRVRATDAAGNLSPYSNTASATTPHTRHDAADAAGDADRERGQRQRGRPVLGCVHRQRRCHRLPGRALPGHGLHQLRADRAPRPAPTTYKDTSVSASTSYSYRVRATDAAGNLSPYSNTASATTPAARPGWSRRTRLMRARGRPSRMRRGTATTARSRTRRGRRPASTARRCSSTARTRSSRSPTRRRCSCRAG